VLADLDRKGLLRELAGTTSGAEFVCGSSSMEPTITFGQKVVVRAISPGELRVGDVVVFEGAADFILHRVILISPKRIWFLHHGDAPSRLGPRRALTSSLLGKVFSEPRTRPAPKLYWQAAQSLLRAALDKRRRYFYW